MVLVQIGPFLHFIFLGNIGQEYVFYNSLEKKNAFPGYKSKKSKIPKNGHFSKEVNPWPWSKLTLFPPFFF